MDLEAVRATARLLTRAGLAWVPVPVGHKSPVERRWQEPRARPDPEHVTNIGVLVRPELSVVDVDLDSPLAALAAGVLVAPGPGVVRYGRRSRTVSHVLVREHGYAGPRRVRDPHTRTTLLEARTGPCQSIVPPSVHPSGEPLWWVDDPELLLDTAEPGTAERVVRRVGAAAVLAASWDPGTRHDLSLAVAGWLVRLGWPGDEVTEFVAAVAAAAGDEEGRDRAAAAVATVERFGEHDTTGLPTVAAIAGDAVASAVRALLAPPAGTRRAPGRVTLEQILDAVRDLDTVRVVPGRDSGALALLWDGRRWVTGSYGLIRRAVVEAVARTGADSRWYDRTVAVAHAVAGGAIPEVVVPLTDLDRDPYLLGCPDGTAIDLRTGERGDPPREAMVTRAVGVDPDDPGDHDLLLDVLTRATGSRDAVDYLQLLAGATLIGAPAKTVVVVYGPTDTGKTLFLVDGFCAALGTYAVQLDPDKVVSKRADRTELWLSRAVGRRLVVVSEPDPDLVVNSALFKQTTGRGQVTVRQLYGQPVEVTASWTLWVDTNHLPTVTDTDEAVWRRLRAVQFANRVRRVPGEAGYVPAFLLEWRRAAVPALLRWAVEGAARVVREVGDPSDLPRSLVDSSGEWQAVAREGSVEEFVDLLRAGTTFTPRPEVYQAYLEWAARAGNGPPLSRQGLYRAIEERGLFRFATVDGRRGWYLDLPVAAGEAVPRDLGRLLRVGLS